MAGSSSDVVFQWGNKEPGTESSYESMCCKGVWYNLYDCVFCKSGMKLPFVGKLMRLFEDEAGVRKVRIRWFFRPYELPLHAIKDLSEDTLFHRNELFIALGHAKGVENENLVEVIQGKAMVFCTTKFGGNMMPSRVHIDAANYVFNQAYDVALKKVVKMVNIPNKYLAQKFSNKAKWIPMVKNMEIEEAKSFTIEDRQSSNVKTNVGNAATKRNLLRISSIDSTVSQPCKKLKEEVKIEGY